jgi:methyl-accepting chemotaxis protein/methyl-accepting chemotaxis protein-1 (serine sensor receptor)
VKPTRRAIGSTTIGQKLFLSFGAAMAITLLIAFVGFIDNTILTGTIEQIVASNAGREVIAEEIRSDVGELLSVERAMNLRALVDETGAADGYHRQFLEHSGKIDRLTAELSPLLASGADRQLCSEIAAGNRRLLELHNLTYAQIHAQQVPPAADPGSSASSTAAGNPTPSGLNGNAYASYLIERDHFLSEADLSNQRAIRLIEGQRELIRLEAQHAQRTEMRSRWITGLMVVLFFVVCGVLLRIILDSNQSLRQIAADLGLGAAQIAAAAAQVSASSKSLARGASEQAAFIEATSNSAEEINAMARRNTDNAEATARVVADSQRHVEEGNRALGQMLAAMDGIALSSAKISKIVKVIDEIAFQTNILALNAAVEASRAGEAGLSFAVVANEVSDLARRCASAAEDTTELIDDCIAKSKTGKLKLDEVANAIGSITAESSKVKLLVDEIHLGSREQSRGVDTVSRAVLQMEKVTHGTATGAEQSAAAAEQLNTQFQTIREIARDLAAMLGSRIEGGVPPPPGASDARAPLIAALSR